MKTREDLEHSGFIGIIGRPNVGKSTLINQLASRKLAIVSSKPQTTRHQIRAIINKPKAQIIFIDTPGFHKPKDNLGRRLNRKVRNAMVEVDVILFIVDGHAGVGRGDAFIVSELENVKTPMVAALNKIDLMSSEEIKKELQKVETMLPTSEIMKISASMGTGVNALLTRLESLLGPGPMFYPEGVDTDQPEKVMMAEFIREKVIDATREELPYAVAVQVEEVKKRKGKRDLVDVYARICVERESQKGIIIGSGGRMLVGIGSRARADIENMLGTQIYLDLIVVVKKDWRRQDRTVDEFGY